MNLLIRQSSISLTAWRLAAVVLCTLLSLSGISRAEDSKEVLAARKAVLEKKLQRVVIPLAKFNGATPEDAMAFVRTKCGEMYLGEEAPLMGDVHFKVMRSYGFVPKPVSLEEKNITAAALVDKIAEQAGMKALVTSLTVTLWPKEQVEKAMQESQSAAPAGPAAPMAVMGIKVPAVLGAMSGWVWSASLRASLLALVVLGIQFLFGRRLPAVWRHALWLPVVLVLILPVLPKIPFHPLARKLAEVSSTPVAVEMIATEQVVTPAARVAVSPSPRVNWLAVTWLSGACCVLGAGVVGYRRNLKRISLGAVKPDGGLTASIELASRDAGLRRAPRVLMSPGVESPAVTGLLRPVLLLPQDFPAGFTASETRLILLHELTHLKRRDLPVNWLLCGLQALHWFNPVLWFAFARMRADREAACDAQVLALDAEDRRADYGHALLKLQSAGPRSGLSLGFVGIFERGADLRSRIRGLSAPRRSHPAWRITGAALVGMLTLFGATQAKEPRRPAETAKADAKAKDPRQVAIEKKLDAIVIPVIDFEDTSIEEAIDFLRLRSVELDKNEPEAARKGINFVIRKARGGKNEFARIASLRLKNATLRQVLMYVADSTKTRFKVDEFAVTFVSAAEEDAPDEAPVPGKPKAHGKAIEAAGKIIIPVVDLQNTTLAEAVDFLSLRAAQLSADKKGPTIVLTPKAKQDAVITQLQLRNVPLSEAVRYVADAAKQPWSADDQAIHIGGE